MNKKQKKALCRTLITAACLIGFSFIPAEGSIGFLPLRWLRLALYLGVYLIIGWDILKAALHGIRNRQVFDENFLMAVATLGALALAVYENGDYLEAIAVMLFYQWLKGALGWLRNHQSAIRKAAGVLMIVYGLYLIIR